MMALLRATARACARPKYLSFSRTSPWGITPALNLLDPRYAVFSPQDLPRFAKAPLPAFRAEGARGGRVRPGSQASV